MSEPGEVRVVNFGPGPATLPLPVLEQVRGDLRLPSRHRHLTARDLPPQPMVPRGARGGGGEPARTLLAVPASHRVVFCQGGATQQFSMVPMNLLRAALISRPGRTCRPAPPPTTSSPARGEPRPLERPRRKVPCASRGRAPTTDSRGSRAADAWTGSPDAAYLHITTNETIEGVAVARAFPRCAQGCRSSPTCPRTSSRVPSTSGRFGLAVRRRAEERRHRPGVTIVIVATTCSRRVPDGLPTMLDYRTFVGARVALQHASRVRDLRRDARDPLAPRRRRWSRRAGPSEPGEGRRAVRGDRRERRLLPGTRRTDVALPHERHVPIAERRSRRSVRRRGCLTRSRRSSEATGASAASGRASTTPCTLEGVDVARSLHARVRGRGHVVHSGLPTRSHTRASGADQLVGHLARTPACGGRRRRLVVAGDISAMLWNGVIRMPRFSR